MDFKTVSIVKGLIALSLGSLLLVGCKTTQQAGLGQDRTYDPNQIEDYQLPILVGDIQTQRSFRQFKARETWFWALLNNDTFLPGENVIVQIISDAPLKQPPEIFAFSVPESAGDLAYNPVGPFQSWTTKTKSGGKCIQAHQNIKMEGYWISIFTHYCTQDKNQDLSWVSDFQRSPMLEGF